MPLEEVSFPTRIHLSLVVEKYTKTTRFCFICNYVSKIIPALQSRCTRFRFGPLDDLSVTNKLNEVAKNEGITLEQNAAKAIVSLSGGDMRKILNILESCSLAYKSISADKVYEVTGRPSIADIKTIYSCLTGQHFKAAFDTILSLKNEKSLSVDDIIRDLHQEVMRTKMPDSMKMVLV